MKGLILIVVLACFSFSMDLDSGLIAYYPFNGNALDNSGGNSHGIEFGSIDYGEGIQGEAALFDGIDDYVLIPEPSSIDDGDLVDFSVSFHILANNTSGISIFINKHSDSNHNIQTFSGSIRDGKITFSTEALSGVNSGIITEPIIDNSTWYHVVYIFDESKLSMKMYIDGLEVGSVIASDYPGHGIGDLFLGRTTIGDGYYLNGSIDEVRIYNRVLSEIEIQELYEGPIACPEGEQVQTLVDTIIPNAEIDIRYGPQNLVTGDSFDAIEGETLQWRLTASGYNSAWKTYVVTCQSPVLEVTDNDYCNLLIVSNVQGSEVDLRYGPQNLIHDDQVYLPKGKTIQWRLNVNGFNSAWKSILVGENNCVLNVNPGEDYCDLLIDIPFSGGEVDLRYGPQNLVQGDLVQLPLGNTIQWRLNVNGYNSIWKSILIDGECILSVDEDDFCEVAVQIPYADSHVDLRYGPQNLIDGDIVLIPKEKTIQWRVNASGYNSAWKPYLAGNPCNLIVSDLDVCELTIQNPIPDSEVDLRYGPQNLLSGDVVNVPIGKTIQWRLTANGYNSSWKNHLVDETCVLAVTESDYCNLEIDIPFPDGMVDLRYGPQNLVDGQIIDVPTGKTVQWRLQVNGYNSAWKSIEIGGGCVLSVTDEDYCDLQIVIGEDDEVDLRYGPQNLVNGSMVILPKGKTIQWRLNGGAWETFTVGAGGCSLSIYSR